MENDPMLPRKVDLEKNPSGTELKIAQHRELEKHGGETWKVCSYPRRQDTDANFRPQR